ncbi:MAG: HEPN domain-containing protein [Selenomonadaceae bacterium]|nr:HEPN domain-containing protein [Selenomonadaceae bacterium]
MRDLTKYRLEAAAERLTVSKNLADGGHYKISITNSYYAIFNAVRALLSEAHLDFKKHSAVISYFRREYIKTSLFEVKFSDYIGDAFSARQYSDYADFFIVSREQAETQYQHAVEFVEAVKNYLEAADDNS